MRYEHEDIAFDVPAGYEDRSVVLFSAPPGGRGLATNVVLTRDRLATGETLRRYADRQLIDLGKQLRELVLLSSGPRDVAGKQAFEMVCTWHAPTGVVEQHLLLIANGDRVMTLAVTAQQGRRDELDAALSCVLSSLLVGGAPVSRAFAPPPPPSQAPRTVQSPPASEAPVSSPSGRHRRTMVMEAIHAPSMGPPASSVMPIASVARTPSPPPPPSSAEAAAASLAALRWSCEPTAVSAFDLSIRMPWAVRHPLVLVKGAESRWLVVAQGASTPLVFDAERRMGELNRLLRSEGVRLPHGIEATRLADAIFLLLDGPAGFVGCPAFLEAQRAHLGLWLTPPQEESERIFRHHCAPPLLAEREGQWTLDFSVFLRTGAIEACRAAGDLQHVRTFERKTVVKEGRLRFPFAA